MENIIISIILVLIVGFAIFYIVKEKKKGRRCIGCPSSGKCSRKQCGCGKEK
ncbi:MAG: FeoB-associated Cys-rich membrane protein [Eubacterium sp.]|nr:FeoB-associated Cys-rich membrane protein [Eubacterium sp.]